MAGELLLVNPRKRRKHKKARASVRPRKRRRIRRAVRAVVRRIRRHRSRRSVVVAHSNPIRRHKARRRMSRYSSNPISSPVSFLKGQIVPSAIGAAGALGLDVLLGMLPLPAMLTTGYARPVVRVVGAVGLGMLASAVAGKKIGEQVAAGAITVTLYDVMKDLVVSAMPTLSLSGYDNYNANLGWMSPAQQVGEYVDGMGQYVE